MYMYIYTYMHIQVYLHIWIKIHRYKKDNLKSPIQTNIN